MEARLAVRDIYEDNEVTIHQDAMLAQQALPALNSDTFRDQRWENALSHLRANDLADADNVREILLEGARAFGMWRVSEPALRSLAAQVLESAHAVPSVGLKSWVSLNREAASDPQEGQREFTDLNPARKLSLRSDPRPTKRACMPRGRCVRLAQALKVSLSDTVTLVKWSLAILLIAASAAYASWVVWIKYVGILHLFAWPILFARAAGLATAVITGLLYLTMARTFMKQAYKLLSVNSKVRAVLDGHKDAHVFLAKCLGAAASVHVLAHLLSTVPALEYGSADQLNSILACADREHKLKGWPSMELLQWPTCPLKMEFMSWGEILFESTPGLSGVVLVILLMLLGWTGRAKARSQKFDRFWHMHNFILVAWPLAMFVHGSNQWIGVGFPLVAFTSSVPICLVLVDRAMRLLRYYLYSGRAVKIAAAVIRPGKEGGPSGALTHLQIQKPPGLWTFVPGMYAFINMPEYAPLQWHPFTICSGKDDEHVEFIISGVGDWTEELAARCLHAQTGHCALPRVALDGPYAAPAQSALARPIMVAVGAGVGITPFLSLMSSLISLIESSSESEAEALPLKEAHFFWMTRSADEFLFGRKHFTRIASSPQLRQKVHLHLHATAKEPDGDAAAYLFRQAVKRQSVLDRAAFAEECDGRQVLTAPQLPWCWVNKSKLDVMWLSDLTAPECGYSDVETHASVGTDTPPDESAFEAMEEGRAGGAPSAPALASTRSISDAITAARSAQPATLLRRSASPVKSIPVDTSATSLTVPSPSSSPRFLAPPQSSAPPEVGSDSSHSGQSVQRVGSEWAQDLLRTSHRRLSTRVLSNGSRRHTRTLTISSRPLPSRTEHKSRTLASGAGTCSPPRAMTGSSEHRAMTGGSSSPGAAADHSGSPARTRSRRGRAPSSPSGADLEEGVSGLPGARKRQPHFLVSDEVIDNDEPGVVLAGYAHRRAAPPVEIDTGAPHADIGPCPAEARGRQRSPAIGGAVSLVAEADEGAPIVEAESGSDREDEEILVPVAFGRPDFKAELRSIGQHWHSQDKVHVYVCGNDAIVQNLRSTADALNAEARANAQEISTAAQKYIVAFERFG